MNRAIITFFVLLILLVPINSIAGEISKITVRNENFEVMTVLEDSSSINLFETLWKKKVKVTLPSEINWQYKIEIYKGYYDTWLYSPEGYVSVLSKAKVPTYKMSSVDEFNKLIGVNNRPLKRYDAKRQQPKEVEPIIHEGVRYIAPHFKVIGNQVKQGYVEAWEVKSNKKLWELQIYKVTCNPSLEGDVQDVFITSLTIEGNRLVVTNERNEKYEVNLKTKKIRKIK